MSIKGSPKSDAKHRATNIRDICLLLILFIFYLIFAFEILKF